jgi:haloalkane dehalogenase
MKFIQPPAEELSCLRADPVLWEQEVDVRPDVAEALEHATGIRAGRVYWRSAHDHLYAMELADLGRGRPSMAMIYGFWDRFEPRPPEHEIDADLAVMAEWVADTAPSLDPPVVHEMLSGPLMQSTWAPGSILRSPADRFTRFAAFPYEAKTVDVEGLQMAYVERGTGDPILMLHGVPAWGYLFRRMLPPFAGKGRAIAPDLIGFGRSDKPAAPYTHSAAAHVRWMRGFIEKMDLQRITLVGHGWGGAVGLRVISDMPQRFARVVVMNTDLPEGSQAPAGFLKWRRETQRSAGRDVAALVGKLDEADAAAYRAPFPAREYEAAVASVPRLIPVRPGSIAAYQNRQAIERLRKLDLPVLIASTNDDWLADSTSHLRSVFGKAKVVEFQGGHFLPEERGEELAREVVKWMG